MIEHPFARTASTASEMTLDRSGHSHVWRSTRGVLLCMDVDIFDESGSASRREQRQAAVLVYPGWTNTSHLLLTDWGPSRV